MPQSQDVAFTYRGARSASVFLGLGLALLVETVGLHAWLRTAHSGAAWTLTTLSLVTLAWLGLDYYRMGRGVILVRGPTVLLAVGLRASASISVGAITEALRPTWRDLPAPGTPDAAEYRNLMKPTEPNVLLRLREPIRLSFAGGLSIPARRLGLYVDDPDRFLVALAAAQSVLREAAT